MVSVSISCTRIRRDASGAYVLVTGPEDQAINREDEDTVSRLVAASLSGLPNLYHPEEKENT
jgi:hypothetical protein